MFFYGCNGTKKDAAYECADYLDKAYEAFDDGYHQIQQARRSSDWNSTRTYLRSAMYYFDDAERYSKDAANIASDYDYDVESYSKKAMTYASDARSYAQKAFSSTDDDFVDYETKLSQSASSEGMSLVKKAKDNLWY